MIFILILKSSTHHRPTISIKASEHLKHQTDQQRLSVKHNNGEDALVVFLCGDCDDLPHHR